MKAYTVCAIAQASFFTVLCPFSQRDCQIVEEVWMMREQVVKLCKKCYRKSCKYMRNDSTRLQGKKKTSTSQYQSFEHNGMEICDQQRLNSLKRKKAVHISCRHGIRRICKLYTKGRPAGKLTWCEPSSNHLDYRWWDNIQRSSPQNTGLAKTATTLHLENCECRHVMGARTFYTSLLRKCQKS